MCEIFGMCEGCEVYLRSSVVGVRNECLDYLSMNIIRGTCFLFRAHQTEIEAHINAVTIDPSRTSNTAQLTMYYVHVLTFFSSHGYRDPVFLPTL